MAEDTVSVSIEAETGDLRDGLQQAQSATAQSAAAMGEALDGLGATARRVQSQIQAAFAQIRAAAEALRAPVAEALNAGASVQEAAHPAAASSPRGHAGAGAAPGPDTRLQQWRETLEQQLSAEQAFFKDSKQQELAFWQDKVGLAQDNARVLAGVNHTIRQLEKELAQQDEQDALHLAESRWKIREAELAREEKAIRSQTGLGRITADEEAASLQALLARKEALYDQYYDAAQQAAERDTRTRERLDQQYQLQWQRFLGERAAIEQKAAADNLKLWQGYLRPVQQAFTSTVQGLIQGTLTLRKAVQNLAQSVLASFVDMGVRMLTNWVATELGMTAATETGAAARASAEQQGALAGLLAKAASAIKNILNDGVVTAAGVSANMAPEIGPAALGVGAAAGAAVAALSGSVLSSAGGLWQVPQDTLAMVHKDETILPADIAGGLRGMFGTGTGGAAQSGAPPIVVNVSAMDSQSFTGFLKSNPGALAAGLRNAMRQNALRPAGGAVA